MSQHLGIGLGAELMALLLHLGTERGVVLDDPIVHEGELPGTVEMRMGVLPGNPSVGGPARVTDAGVTSQRALGNDATKGVDATNFLANGNDPLLKSGYPCGIVASILQPTQSLQKNGHSFSLTDISNDSTHD
jgi:hypothetical protein